MFTMPMMREMVKKVKTRGFEYFESFLLFWLGRSGKQHNSIVIHGGPQPHLSKEILINENFKGQISIKFRKLSWENEDLYNFFS